MLGLSRCFLSIVSSLKLVEYFKNFLNFNSRNLFESELRADVEWLGALFFVSKIIRRIESFVDSFSISFGLQNTALVSASASWGCFSEMLPDRNWLRFSSYKGSFVCLFFILPNKN